MSNICFCSIFFVREKENTGGIAGGTNTLIVSRPNMFGFLRRKSSVYETYCLSVRSATEAVIPYSLGSPSAQQARGVRSRLYVPLLGCTLAALPLLLRSI
jgi:hypothetical protein